MTENLENPVKHPLVPRYLRARLAESASFDTFLKSPFGIMGVGPKETNARGDALIENENTLQVRKHREYESGHDALRIREVRALLPRLYAPHSLERREHSGPRANQASAKTGSHRLPAIALTRIIPSPCLARPGASVCLLASLPAVRND